LFEAGHERMLKRPFICRSSGVGYKVPASLDLAHATMSRLRARFLLSLLVGAGVVLAGAMVVPARAGEDDHELARQALQQGKVLPLRTVLDQVERSQNGQVIKIEFEHDDGRFIYELRVLHPGGEVSKLKVDAVDGRVLSIRRKGRD
jgi:hypothetical protein